VLNHERSQRAESGLSNDLVLGDRLQEMATRVIGSSRLAGGNGAITGIVDAQLVKFAFTLKPVDEQSLLLPATSV